MNKRQKAILTNFVIVILITAAAVGAMINFKDWVNRSEAKVAMTELGNRIKKYRAEHGSVPPESYVDRERENLQGNVRLGKLHYRTMWIDFESTQDEILCYTERKSHSLIFRDEFLILRLGEVLGQDVDVDVNVEWMGKREFEALLAQQQTPMQIEMLDK